MGWTFVKNKPAVLTPAAYIEQECFPANDEQEVVLRATVNDTVFFALKVKKPDPILTRIYEAAADGSIIMAVVAIFEIRGPEFGWKMMDETVGPNCDPMPAAFRAKLSNVKEGAPGYAAKFRARQKEEA